MPLTETESAAIRDDIADAAIRLMSVLYDMTHARVETPFTIEELQRAARLLDAARNTANAAIQRMQPQ